MNFDFILHQQQPHDVLVVDLGLPDEDGLSLILRLRRLGLRAPVLILSARRSVDDRVRGLEQGGDDYLTKLSQPQDQAEAVFVRQAEIDDQHIVRALDGHALGGPGVPRCFYLVSGFSQRTLEEALNFDFILHQQNPHVLMLIYSCRVPL